MSKVDLTTLSTPELLAYSRKFKEAISSGLENNGGRKATQRAVEATDSVEGLTPQQIAVVQAAEKRAAAKKVTENRTVHTGPENTVPGPRNVADIIGGAKPGEETEVLGRGLSRLIRQQGEEGTDAAVDIIRRMLNGEVEAEQAASKVALDNIMNMSREEQVAAIKRLLNPKEDLAHRRANLVTEGLDLDDSQLATLDRMALGINEENGYKVFDNGEFGEGIATPLRPITNLFEEDGTPIRALRDELNEVSGVPILPYERESLERSAGVVFGDMDSARMLNEKAGFLGEVPQSQGDIIQSLLYAEERGYRSLRSGSAVSSQVSSETAEGTLGFIGRYAPQDQAAMVESSVPGLGSIEAGGAMGMFQTAMLGGAIGGALSVATGGEFGEGTVAGGIAGLGIRGVTGAIRANGAGLERAMYRSVLGEVSTEGMTQAKRVAALRGTKDDSLGFVQSQAKSMLLSDRPSMTQQSRGAIMGGAALSGMMFTSNKKDRRRGFNKHRGNRI